MLSCQLLLSCTTAPEQIVFGKDQCHFCKMTIADPKYGAEVITKKGRILKFDATECMINQLNQEPMEPQSLLVIGYDTPEKLHPAGSLSYIISPDYQSPMGAHLAAFSDTSALSPEERSKALDWNELVNKFITE